MTDHGPGPGPVRVPPTRAARRRGSLERWVLAGPGLLFLAAFFLVPIGIVLATAFFKKGRFGGVIPDFTLANLERALDPTFVKVLGVSLAIAGITTLLALLLGYPAAWAIARLSPRIRTAVLILVVLPFWTSFLIRTYAWVVLLNSQGPLNGTLVSLGLIGEPLSLLYTPGAVVAGLLYAYLPLMILPLYASIERLDPELMEAAANLGAPPRTVFRTVMLPMTLPGILTGCIFVFVPSLGNFVVPELLGGGKLVMVGNLIRDQFLKARDWPFGATLALIVIAFLAVLLVLQARASRAATAIPDA